MGRTIPSMFMKKNDNPPYGFSVLRLERRAEIRNPDSTHAYPFKLVQLGHPKMVVCFLASLKPK